MSFNLIADWASIISLLLGLISIYLSTSSIKKVNKFTGKSKNINRSKINAGGIGNTVVGRDYNDKQK